MLSSIGGCRSLLIQVIHSSRNFSGVLSVLIPLLVQIQIRLNWISRPCFILSRCNFCSLHGIPHDWTFSHYGGILFFSHFDQIILLPHTEYISLHYAFYIKLPTFLMKHPPRSSVFTVSLSVGKIALLSDIIFFVSRRKTKYPSQRQTN